MVTFERPLRTNRLALVLYAAAPGLVAVFVTVLSIQPALGMAIPSRLIFRSGCSWTRDFVGIEEIRRRAAAIGRELIND